LASDDELESSKRFFSGEETGSLLMLSQTLESMLLYLSELKNNSAKNEFSQMFKISNYQKSQECLFASKFVGQLKPSHGLVTIR
jgi:hypothetical protein